MEDRVLKSMIQDELDWQPSIDSTDIGVTVESGIVHLTGRVADYAQQCAAEIAVKRIKGVRGYVDDLEIRRAPSPDTDEAIAERVANLIDWDVTMPHGAVKVKVAQGVVTLTGEVPWAHQRDAAEKGVRRLTGVRGLNNLVSVKPTVAASDVKRRIESALSRQASLEAAGVSVAVDGAHVRLTGAVHSFPEREIIERAAWAAPGVTGVDDQVAVVA